MYITGIDWRYSPFTKWDAPKSKQPTYTVPCYFKAIISDNFQHSFGQVIKFAKCIFLAP